MVRVTGVEPAQDSPPDPKSGASANSAIPAYKPGIALGRRPQPLLKRPIEMPGYIQLGSTSLTGCGLPRDSPTPQRLDYYFYRCPRSKHLWQKPVK